MPIVFDEVTAEIAPPAETSGRGGTQEPSARDAAPDPVEQVRHALALLREREARSRAD